MILFHFINSISGYFDRYVYLILFILIFLEEAGIPLPIPGDIYVFLAGYQVHKHDANAILIMIDILISTVLGASVLFWLAKAKGEPLVEKYGKYIFLSPDKLQKGKEWFSKTGEIVILLGRWIPGLRIIMTVVGGILNLEYYKFILAIAGATVVWSGVFLYLGIQFSGKYRNFLHVFRNISIKTPYIEYLVSFLVGVAILYAIVDGVKRVTRKQ